MFYCVADTLLYPQLVVRVLMSAILASMCTDKKDFLLKSLTRKETSTVLLEKNYNSLFAVIEYIMLYIIILFLYITIHT